MKNEDIIVFAFRYAIGTYALLVYSVGLKSMKEATYIVVDYLKDNWITLSNKTQKSIKSEIKEAIKLNRVRLDCIEKWGEILKLK